MAAAEANGLPVGASQYAWESHLRQVLTEIEQAYRDVAQPAADAVQKAQGFAVADGVAGAARLGRVAGAVQWESPTVQAIEALAGSMGDGSPLKDHFESIGPDAARAIRQAIAEGIAAGDGSAAVGKRIRAQVSMSRARSETIARTETLRAYREATRQSYAANADVLDGWIRVCSGDRRTCPACWALHGKRYAVEQPCATHPNCRCVMVPDVTGAGIEVPSADDLLGRMDEAGQIEALGASRHEMWKAGTPVSAFGAERNDPRWGAVAEVVPLGALR